MAEQRVAMDDAELAVFLGIDGTKERDAILAAVTPRERATYEHMAWCEAELKAGRRPAGVIVCRESRCTCDERWSGYHADWCPRARPR